jgi:hypothetical protein
MAIEQPRKQKDGAVDNDLKRRLIQGILNLVLTSLAAWLAIYLTNKILGKQE